MARKIRRLTTIGILGLGEVGSAIKKLAKDKFIVLVKDLKINEFHQSQIKVLHVCIPYTGHFNQTVIRAVQAYQPKLVIINSTVKPGTTRIIYQSTQVHIVHTPIMGVHPNLAKYQKQFIKVIGAMDKASYKLARAHWQRLGAPKIIPFSSPEQSELAKLLCTTYYGWNIIFNKIVYRLCQQTGTDFNQVYTQFNQVYNLGYKKTKPNVIRPILNHIPGPIGGHCIIPNLEILNTITKDKALKWMLLFNQQLEDEPI